MKGFCRGMSFILTGLYTCLLIKEANASWVVFTFFAVAIGTAANYGWDFDDQLSSIEQRLDTIESNTDKSDIDKPYHDL